jgi:hypothetical protein
MVFTGEPMSVLIFLLAWTVVSLPLGILVGRAIAEIDDPVGSDAPKPLDHSPAARASAAALARRHR